MVVNCCLNLIYFVYYDIHPFQGFHFRIVRRTFILITSGVTGGRTTETNKNHEGDQLNITRILNSLLIVADKKI